MKTVGKRINPAFTVAQPLPAWPVWPARQFDQTTDDRRAAALSGTLLAGMVTAEIATTGQKNTPSVATAN